MGLAANLQKTSRKSLNTEKVIKLFVKFFLHSETMTSMANNADDQNKLKPQDLAEKELATKVGEKVPQATPLTQCQSILKEGSVIQEPPIGGKSKVYSTAAVVPLEKYESLKTKFNQLRKVINRANNIL